MVKIFLNLKICPKKLQGEYIWRQDVSLQWCKGSKSLLSERFGYPYRRPGDSFFIRETPGLSGRVGMYGKVHGWKVTPSLHCLLLVEWILKERFLMTLFFCCLVLDNSNS